jgi:hypothetical protein
MNAMEELLRGHIRGCREAIAEASSRVDALEALAKKIRTNTLPGRTTEKHHGWAADENHLLQSNYSTIGAVGCAKLLPHRSYQAVRAQASRLGLSLIGKIWCEQCEARVTQQQIASCQSKFCPEKVTRE